ncbi:hypothetical protein PR048_015882 [Dryococelus australis]|uniref:Uncharacterized protein n=1 Tax=Dryococelus australis TaxID=614101 RepID=A0ABQ9HI57_9NEOP|nr:hypothetical protein PR048_015882 [Dryococelus australis]
MSTTAKPYLEAMVLWRKMLPFTLTFDRNLMKDWSGALVHFFLDSPVSKDQRSFKIQSYVQTKFMDQESFDWIKSVLENGKAVSSLEISQAMSDEDQNC